MADETKTEQKPLFRSALGNVVAGSVTETDAYTQATVQQGPNPEYAVKVRAYKNKPEVHDDFKAAIAAGDQVLVRGRLLGQKKNDNVHIAINSVNEPLEVKGRVTNVTFSAPDKQPFVNLWLMQEVSGRDGQEYKIGKAVQAFGEFAEQLADVKVGDRINAEVREIVQRRGEGENLKYVEALQIVGKASVGDKVISNDQPAPEDDIPSQPFPDNTSPSDYEDEIPF